MQGIYGVAAGSLSGIMLFDGGDVHEDPARECGIGLLDYRATVSAHLTRLDTAEGGC